VQCWKNIALDSHVSSRTNQVGKLPHFQRICLVVLLALPTTSPAASVSICTANVLASELEREHRAATGGLGGKDVLAQLVWLDPPRIDQALVVALLDLRQAGRRKRADGRDVSIRPSTRSTQARARGSWVKRIGIVGDCSHTKQHSPKHGQLGTQRRQSQPTSP
jgi:hypothetical protein